MQDEEQFKQLMLQYNQLKNGSLDIRHMIEIESFDSAITMIKSREPLFLNCKCMLKFLELTDEQKKEVDKILEEIRCYELENMRILEEGIAKVKDAMKKTQQTVKFQKAYQYNENQSGSILNYTEEL